jgi:hypothetical protein
MVLDSTKCNKLGDSTGVKIANDCSGLVVFDEDLECKGNGVPQPQDKCDNNGSSGDEENSLRRKLSGDEDAGGSYKAQCSPLAASSSAIRNVGLAHLTLAALLSLNCLIFL